MERAGLAGGLQTISPGVGEQIFSVYPKPSYLLALCAGPGVIFLFTTAALGKSRMNIKF